MRRALRLGTMFAAGVLGVTALIIACGDAPPEVGSANPSPTPGAAACGTPQEGCPCATPGAVVACGQKVSGGLSTSFIYCYEGFRTCETTGRWGSCGEGSIQTKSLASLHTMNVGGSATSCTNGLGTQTSLCKSGKNKGQTCLTNADCSPGERYCTGASELTTKCKDDGDCSLLCGLFNGHCTGGTVPGIGCNDNLLCLGGGTCTLPGGGNDCTSTKGLCVGGTNDSLACVNGGDCPGGSCDDTTSFGQCLGGKHNGKTCKKDAQCTPGGSCSNSSAASGDAAVAVNPCDPYCNVFSDTNAGFDAGPGFTFADGGITLGVTCGDGIVGGAEKCDDKNTMNGDGCSSTCQIEAGYFCPTPGALCSKTLCGNGVKEGAEQCDDANTTAGDGCSSTCQLETGYYCPDVGMPCKKQICGNGTVEGTEQCDDSNSRPYDGCYNCQREVKCPVVNGGNATPCDATCGDGIKFSTEDCDDGNLIDGDGCDKNCKVEVGSVCTEVLSALPGSIDVPVIYRDFWPNIGSPANGHPDFEHDCPRTTTGYACKNGASSPNTHTGIMKTELSASDRAPVANPSGTFKNECNEDSVNDWYRDTTKVAGKSKIILGRYLRLFRVGTTSSYEFFSDTDSVKDVGINCGDGTNSCSTTLTSGIKGFFPIQNLGWGNYYPTTGVAKANFHFTSEVRLPFTYKGDGSEVFNFTGDDDVFVYVGGKLISDLGGIHNPISSPSITLNASTKVFGTSTNVNLVVGNTYELDVFQAERNTTGSNYKLTLAGFQRRLSSCTPPPPPQTLTRDYQATCPIGNAPVWSVFRWKAAVPNTASQIDFRAATAMTQAALPTDKTDPSTVSAGSATSTNSPAGGTVNWQYLKQATAPFDAIPIEAQLKAATPQKTSQAFLRVFMTFTGAPVLYEWQMLYDCVPAE